MNLPLYKVADEYMAILRTLQEQDLPAEVISDTLEGEAGDLEAKSLSVGAYVLNLEAEAGAIKVAEKNMSERRKALESHAGRLRDYLQATMERCQRDEIKSPEFRLKLKKNPPSVVIADDAAIPSWFKREVVLIETDKVAIKEAIAAGETVPGAHIEQRLRLEIK